MELVSRAYVVARVAHTGQVDKSGEDYFQHVVAVAQRAAWIARERGLPELVDKLHIVGVLHDTVEDTPLDLDDLYELGFRDDVHDAIRLLTFIKGATHDSHDEYVRAIANATTPGALLAQIVKRADAWHNSLPERSTYRNPKSLQKRYERTEQILDGVL